MIHRPAFWAPAIAVGIWAVVGGCGARTAGRTLGCQPGALGCRCHDNGTCDDGLGCVAGVCVASRDAATGGAPAARPPPTARGTGGSLLDAGPPPLSACQELELNPDECGRVELVSEQPEIQLLLVLDKSGSMAMQHAGSSMSRWEALRTAVAAVFDSPTAFTGFGLQLFPAKGAPAVGESQTEFFCQEDCCELPDYSELNVEFMPTAEAAPAIEAELQTIVPAGATPTAAALQRALGLLVDGPAAHLPGDKYVLLATDGGANCNPGLSCEVDSCTHNIEYPQCPTPPGYGPSCCLNNPAGCLDQTDTMERIEDLYANGFQTIVVGLPGNELYSEVLNEFAVAGGAENPAGPHSYFEISATGEAPELVDALQSISRNVLRSCETVIPPDVAARPLALNSTLVAIDCQELPLHTPTGRRNWDYIYDARGQPTAVQLLGDVCDRLQSEGVDRIDIFFVCTHPLL